MSARNSSLSLTALREILAGVERIMLIVERSGQSRRDADDKVGTKLRKLRRQLEEEIERHPDNGR